VVAARYAKQASVPAPPEALDEGLYTIQRVVDGDTLLMANGIRLRLIGVNCPESVKPDWPVEPFGPEASAFTNEFVGQQQVKLQFDREREDRFGRMLAYVYVGDKLLNEELLRAGLARYESHFHYSESMKRRVRKAQDAARDARRGIWSKN
jgi:micrococcal nuclease